MSARLLVVCLGNHCRSPLGAAALARHGARTRSAGLRDRRVGRPAHPDMVTAAADLGYDLADHRGVQVTADLVAWADTVLAMDQAVLDELATGTDPDQHHKLRLYLPGRDVPDPWGRPPHVFADVARLIDTWAAEAYPAASRSTSTSRSAASGRPSARARSAT